MSKQEKQIYETIAAEEPCCMLCGSPYDLNIHHIRYGSCGRNTYLGNLIRLCMNCHSKVHSNKRKWQPVLIVIANEHERQMNRQPIENVI